MPIKVRYNGLEIDGNLLPLFSGTFHYWRSKRSDWEHIFDQIRGLGFHIIETYIPWSVHELGVGQFDFGKVDENKDLDAFLSLAAQKGFKVLVRPGPCINSELPDFGYPERVLQKKELWARDGDGGPVVLAHMTTAFPVPSYASEAFFSEFDGFLLALAPILQKHLHPHGPIVAIQVDNELGYFFRTGTYELDYSEPSIRLFAHFLELKHRNIKALNEAYGSAYTGFAEVPAPREGKAGSLKELRSCLDWVEYKEYQVLWTLTRLAELFKSRGLGSVPFYHNFFGPYQTPFNVAEVEADSGIDFVGLDGYPHAPAIGGAVDQARYLASTSRLAYFPEYGAGVWPVGYSARDRHDQACAMLAPLMGGAKAVNFYMLVDRDRWLGGPLKNDGSRLQGMAPLFERFNQFVQETEWVKSSPQNLGILLNPRELQWLDAAFDRRGSFSEKQIFPYALNKVPAPEGLFGPGTPGLQAALDFREATRRYAAEAHLPFALADSAVPSERLKKHAFAIVPCLGFLEEGFAKRLRSYVEDGGQLVLGPALPGLNTRFEPLKAFDDLGVEVGKPFMFGDGRLLVLPSFDAKAVGSFLRKAKVIPEVTLSDPSLELALHKSGGRILLFVRNPHAEDRPLTVFREGKFVLKPLWSAGKFLGAVEERDVQVGPHEIKVWELIPC